jgi:hypothetical protein
MGFTPGSCSETLGNMLCEAWVLNLISAIYWGGGGNKLRYTLTAAICTAPEIMVSGDTHRNNRIAVLTHGIGRSLYLETFNNAAV